MDVVKEDIQRSGLTEEDRDMLGLRQTVCCYPWKKKMKKVGWKPRDTRYWSNAKEKRWNPVHYLSPETFPTDILTGLVRISIGIINTIYSVKVFKFQRDRNSHGGSLNWLELEINDVISINIRQNCSYIQTVKIPTMRKICYFLCVFSSIFFSSVMAKNYHQGAANTQQQLMWLCCCSDQHEYCIIAAWKCVKCLASTTVRHSHVVIHSSKF